MITEFSRWRAESGLTQLEAARALGVSQTYFSLLERGARPMTDGLRRKLGAVRSARLRERDADAVEQSFSQDLQQAQALLAMLEPAKLNAMRRLLQAFVDQ